MNLSVIILVAVLLIATLLLITRVMIKEEDLIRKANKNFFYHILAKMTSAKYEGYVMTENEEKVMDEYLSKPSEYDKHPIGSYFKLCGILKDTLSTCANFHNYRLSFNLGEIGSGLAVLALFAIVLTLGVIYG